MGAQGQAAHPAHTWPAGPSLRCAGEGQAPQPQPQRQTRAEPQELGGQPMAPRPGLPKSPVSSLPATTEETNEPRVSRLPRGPESGGRWRQGGHVASISKSFFRLFQLDTVPGPLPLTQYLVSPFRLSLSVSASGRPGSLGNLNAVMILAAAGGRGGPGFEKWVRLLPFISRQHSHGQGS